MMTEELVPVFVPPLALLLAQAERIKRAHLTESEIVRIRDESVCMMMTIAQSEALEKERGFRDVYPENCFVDWQRLRPVITGKGYLPRIILCVLGDSDFRQRVEPMLVAEGVEHEFHEHDERMQGIFETMDIHALSDEDAQLIPKHETVLYVLSDNFMDEEAGQFALRFMQLGAQLFDAGAIVLKCESSLTAHSFSSWTELTDEAIKSYPHINSSLDHSYQFWSSLIGAYVKHPILRDDGDLYTCGLHLLGQPDLIVSTALLETVYDEPYVAVVDLFNVFAMYLLAECPRGTFAPGAGFRLGEDSPRFTLNWEPCTNYEEDDCFFNPYGRWRFESVEKKRDTINNTKQEGASKQERVTKPEDVEALDKELAKNVKVKVSIWMLDETAALKNADIIYECHGDSWPEVHIVEWNIIGEPDETRCCSSNICPQDIVDAMKYLAYANELLVSSMRVQACRATDPDYYYVPTGFSLYRAVHSALSDLMASYAPPPNDRRDVGAFRQKLLAKHMLPLLKKGMEGIESWNETASKSYDLTEQTLVFDHTELSGADLEKIELRGTFSESNFSKATMRDAIIDAAIARCNFNGADLSGASFHGVEAQAADFTNANMKDAQMVGTHFEGAIFKDADLTNANFENCDLRQVDLSACKSLKNAKFNRAQYDDATVLPVDFPQHKDLVWVGKGVNPYHAVLRKQIDLMKSANFDEFINHIKEHFDKERFKKVLAMLKKEKFQLFSEVSKNKLGGVVKSQTDKDLVYSCHLDFEGNFSCCTQNLKSCGGLKGALCKHLLVLAIGLVKSGELDSTSATRWVLYSLLKKPKVDKEFSSDLFLKYKATEAGEIDWRPTETVPEDYYAF